jgi:phosphoribosylamine--glycine ligase
MNAMNVLIVGSGGREHALAWKIKQSPLCDTLFVAPGNAGTALVAKNLPIGVSDFNKLAKACLENDIHMLVVGPEVPLVEGIQDYFASNEALSTIQVVGPSSKAAQLEGSKDFAKAFMGRHGIPTAQYKTFKSGESAEACAFLEGMKPPYVLKADGLAAGKGVLIIEDLKEAKEALQDTLENDKFGSAGSRVVIEEFLDGIEASCFVLTNGRQYHLLPFAKDYKRIGEGDTGLNTGGMGAISPVPFIDEALRAKIVERIVEPTVQGIAAEEMIYEGFVFIGLMICKGEPYVIEYNVRMGDPETEVVMPRLRSDLLALMADLPKEMQGEVNIDSRFATTVMAVSGGYPESYEKGKVIAGLPSDAEGTLFHAGTTEKDGQVVTSGGRVLAATQMGETMTKALQKSFAQIEKISFEGMYYRSDIGFDL